MATEEGTIEVTLRRRRRTRSINLRVHDDGAVVVTRPYWVTNNDVFDFIKRQASWIFKILSTQTVRDPDLGARSRDHYLEHKEAARALAEKKLKEWNTHYNFSYNRVSIRQARTRWGSCSSKGNLNFNYKILFLPEDLQNYLIVHELCHLKEMNHGKNFWMLVGETISYYKEARAKLGKNIF